MSEVSTPTPDNTLAADDPGDETGKRYRFQWTWAAVVCCCLLDDTQDVIEIFCEQHEDVLLKHRDGTFTGHQVKSRDSGQPVWKAGDEQVKASFARFVQLDAAYPGHFRAFRFLTNHPLHIANNAQSLPYVLSQIATAPTLGDLPSNVRRWMDHIVQLSGTDEIVAFLALKKATASDGLPKLGDAVVRLVDTLAACWSGAADCSHSRVRQAAIALVEECGRASTLDHEQVLPAYVIAIDQPDLQVAARITGKRMTLDRVRAILAVGLSATAMLAGDSAERSEPGQGSTELMLKKLDAGGFSAVSENSAEDLRDKADYLGITWTKKLGQDKGLERYEHVRSIALSDSARAFEATKTDAATFGPAMREDLRRRFRQRRLDGDELFDCTDEHLEGFAYSLTSQCQVQWSIDRPWEVA